MASVKISEVRHHSGLQALHVIASACKGFLGPEKSVKLITSPDDDGCEMIFTTQRLLSLLDIEHPSGYLLRDACQSHFKQFGTGCTTLVCMSGAWAHAFENLLSEGIPGDAILQYGDEIINLCLDVCEEEAIRCSEILQTLKVPDDKRQVLLENEKCNHQMKITIPWEEKRSKDGVFGINNISFLPPKGPNTADQSTRVIDLHQSCKHIEVDLPQTLAGNASCLTAMGDMDEVDDVSWYFDSNDEKLEDSHNYPTLRHDDEPLQSDNVYILDNFGTCLSSTCSEDMSLASPVNFHFDRKEESSSSVDEMTKIERRDTYLKSNTNCRNIMSAPLWSGPDAKVAPSTSRNELLGVSSVDGNLHHYVPVPAVSKLNALSAVSKLNPTLQDQSNHMTTERYLSTDNVEPHHSRESSCISCVDQEGEEVALSRGGKMYKICSDASQKVFVGETEEGYLQDAIFVQDENPVMMAAVRSQAYPPAETAALQGKALSTNHGSINAVSSENVTSVSLQDSRKEIDICLKNLQISRKTLPSRISSKEQILRNSRHFQNEDMLPQMNISSEHVITDGGSSLERSRASSIQLSTKPDLDQVHDREMIGPIDMISIVTEAEGKSPFSSPMSTASKNICESSFDSGAELVSGLERRTQLFNQTLSRSLSDQIKSETFDCRMTRQARAGCMVIGLNEACNVTGKDLGAHIYQSSNMSSSQKLEEKTRECLSSVYTSPSSSKILEEVNDAEASSTMISSDVSCSTTTVSQNSPDFKNLCEGLSHGAGMCMSLAGDIFLKNLQSSQFEDTYICRVVGPTSDNATVVHGLVLPCDVKLISLASTLRGKLLKAVLINGDLTKNYCHAGYKGPFEVKVVVDSVKQIPESPQEVWLKKVMDKVNEFQVTLVLVKGHVDASLVDLCLGMGKLIIQRVPYTALQYLSSVSNTAMNSYLRDVSQEDICEGLYLDCWEAGWEATIRSLHTQRTAYVRLCGPYNIHTTVICAPSNPQLQNQEDKFLSSYHKLKDVLKTGLIYPGMGATEIKVMRQLEKYQASILPMSSESFDDDIKRKVAGAFQAGFEEFIISLVQNSRDITKFDVKSCINDLVSCRTTDTKLIQETLFPQSQKNESMQNIFMKSSNQTHGQWRASSNGGDSCSYKYFKGFCTSDSDETVLITDRISQTDTNSSKDGSAKSSQISRSVVFDCFSSKLESWQSAWSLIKVIMSIDSVLTTGLSTKELESCHSNSIIL